VRGAAERPRKTAVVVTASTLLSPLSFDTRHAAVETFHHAALTTEYRDNGPPGERPIYDAGYSGASLLDPDGNNVEVVCHNR
jgi:hypothetical protein